MTGAASIADVDIWSVRLDGPLPDDTLPDDTLPDRAWAVLSDAERERARRLQTPAWRHDFVLSHYATREILARYTGTDPAALEFDRGAHGKPKAAGRVEFSLSHTDGLALVAVSAAEVGVDVETARQAPLAEGLISRCLTAAEQAAVKHATSAASNDATTAFLRYWTAKESYLKGLGIGLDEPIRNVEVQWDDRTCARIARGGATDQRWVLHALEVGPHHIATVAVNTPWPGSAVSVRYLDFILPGRDRRLRHRLPGAPARKAAARA
jgi:4'-phosphopantetheinyl transferase